MADANADIALRVRVIDEATAKFNSITNKLIGNITKLTAGYVSLRAIYQSMTEAEDVAAKLGRTLSGIGAKSLITAEQVNKLATEIQNVSKYSDEAAKSAAEQLIRFGVVTNKSLEPTLRVTAALARQMGTDLPAAASLVSRALLSPTAAARMLRQAGIQLNEVQLKQAKLLLETGDRAGAQKIVLDELLRTTNGGALSVDTFSEALGQLRNKLGDLLEGKEGGLKKATEAVKTFSEVLSDPNVKKAADDLFAAIINGAALAVQGVADLILKIEELLDKSGDKLETWAQKFFRGRAKVWEFFGNESAAASDLLLVADSEAKQKRERRTRTNRRGAGAQAPTVEGTLTDQGTGGTPAKQEGPTYPGHFMYGQTSDYWARMKELTTGVPEYFEEINGGLEEATENFVDVEKSIEELSVYAEEAMRGIQDNIARFMIDPFNEGLKGFAIGILETFRNILAQMAAEKIATSLIGVIGGSSGVAGVFGKFFGKRAGGGVSSGWTLVGENGPELVHAGINSMRVYPRAQMAAGGGSITVAPVYNVDARGATADFVKMLPAILEANSRKTVELARMAIRDDISRGALR